MVLSTKNSDVRAGSLHHDDTLLDIDQISRVTAKWRRGEELSSSFFSCCRFCASLYLLEPLVSSNLLFWNIFWYFFLLSAKVLKVAKVGFFCWISSLWLCTRSAPGEWGTWFQIIKWVPQAKTRAIPQRMADLRIGVGLQMNTTTTISFHICILFVDLKSEVVSTWGHAPPG